MQVWPGSRNIRRRRARARARSYRGHGNPSRVSARHNAFRAELQAIQSELPESLTASGELVRSGQATLLRRLIQPWQIRSFGYYDLLGEIKYAAQFYSRALANLELFAAETNAEGDVVPTENQEVKDALERIRDPGGGGRSGLLAAYGRLMFLVGEALLFVSENAHTELEQWEMLSTDELRLLDVSYTRFKAPSLTATQFKPAPDDAYVPVGDAEAVAYRLWKRHPRYSDLPDATMEGVLDICEELLLLTQAVRARCRSRLAGSGILFIDDRITTRPDEPVPDEDPEEDPFIADLTEAMTLPIMEEGTASAVVPLVARVKVPDGVKMSDLVYHLQIVDPTQLYPETGLRMECIRRLAIGLDMPPEILLGLQDSNHWSAWQVDEQVWKAHLQPVAEQLVGDLTSAYLGPYLKEQGIKDWYRYSIGYDAAAIINHPDRTKDAKDLHDRAVIGDAALLDAAGFDKKDAPNQVELARIIGMKIGDSSLAWDQVPAPRGGSVEVAPGVINQAGAVPVAAPGGEGIHPGPPEGGAEEPPPETVIGSLAAAQKVAMIEGAAGFALLRAREAVGSRLRTNARRDDEVLALIEGIRARDVAVTLGRQRTRLLLGGPQEGTMLNGCRDLIVESLAVFGVNDVRVAELIADAIEKHAIRTLYDARPAPFPPNFSGFVTGLLTTAGLE